MSVTGRALSVLVVLGASSATAQTDDARFFLFKDTSDINETDWNGSLTSSSFLYLERASGDDPLIIPDPGGVVIPAAVDSPHRRLFTDLRTRVTARHIKGGRWDARLDGRVRLVPKVSSVTNEADGGNEYDVQSGQFGGNEYDLREFYAGRNGDRTSIFVGRQFSPELAGVKFDGLKVDYLKNDEWRFLGFAGLYPVRGSRSLTTDYPRSFDPATGEDGSRILPVTGGVGSAYRLKNVYGSFGLVGIYAPGVEERISGANERRFFVTSNGYWRQSSELDLYHFAVFDVESTAGRALTNLTVGANFVPSHNLRIGLNLSHIDTETLNVQAQTRLENPGTGETLDVVLNNVEVARLSQDEGRLVISGAFAESRFEVSASGSIRRRPEVVLNTDTGMNPTTLEAAQAADLMLSVVDRRSIADTRLGLSYLRAFGLGSQNLNRSEFHVVRLNALRGFLDGKGSFEGSLAYVDSSDDNPDMACLSSLTPLDCYGTSTAKTINLGLMGTYRVERNWLAILSMNLGRQNIEVEDANQARLQLPLIYTFSTFFRLAYRF